MMSGWMPAPNALAAFQRIFGTDVVLEAWIDAWSSDEVLEGLGEDGTPSFEWNDLNVRLRLANGRIVELNNSEWASCTLIGGNDG